MGVTFLFASACNGLNLWYIKTLTIIKSEIRLGVENESINRNKKSK